MKSRVSILATVCACSLALSAGVSASIATATVGHRYSGQFGNGQLAGPGGIGIDQATGNAFVSDAFIGLVDKFAANGDFQLQWDGSATPAAYFASPSQVASDGGVVYVDNTFNNSVERYDTSGVYQGQLDPSGTPGAAFSQPSGVAIDPTNGDVYVASTAGGVIDRFDSAGSFLAEFGAGELNSPTQLAVDAAHAVYVLDSGNARVVSYSGGVLGATIDSSSPTAVGVDASTGHIYVADTGPSGNQIADYASDGTLLSSFGTGHVIGATGIAVNATSDRVYVADQGAGAVQTFNAVTLPTVSTTPGASEIEAGSATVAGIVNPEGVAGTTYHFDYGLDTNYGASSPDAGAGGGSAEVPVSAGLTGLTPGTTYHFRVVAINPQGSIAGSDQTFTTSPAQVEVIDSGFASAMTASTATLNATLTPNGAATTYHFEYGPSTGYGSSTEPGSAGSGPGYVPVSAPIVGLTPGTIYHFRVVAENGIGGTVNGEDRTFTTASAALPTASAITSTTAQLHAQVITGLGNSVYHFEYGTDTSYGKSTTSRNAGTGIPEKPVTESVVQLAPGTEYHYRLVTVTNEQTATGPDATFTTIPVATVISSSVTEVTTTTATLHATVDTHGTAGTLTFAVSTSASAYASVDATASLAATNGPQDVSVVLTEIPPGAEYTAQPSATVAGTTVWGTQLTFSTPQQPVAPSISSSIPPAPYVCATVDCGAVSNTGTTSSQQPSNAFTITKASVKGSAVTVTVRVPGPGKLTLTGKNSSSTRRSVGKASTVKLTIHLSKAGKKALAKARNKRLSIPLRVTFTPTGGKAAGKTRTVTFKR